MNDVFCSSSFLIWTVRQQSDTEWLELKRYFFVLWSNLLHSNFVLKRSLSWLSFFMLFVSEESSLSFTFLLLFLAISPPSYPSVKVHSIFPPDLLYTSPRKPFGNCGSAFAQVWLCVHFWCGILLLFLLLGSIEKFVSYIYFDDVCYLNITIYLCQIGPSPTFLQFKLPTDHMSMCRFLSQAFYTAQDINQV